MSKKQQENKAAGDAVSQGSNLPTDSTGLRRAAIDAAREGDQALDQGRFRDAECFISSTKSSRYEEEGFAVHGSSAGDAMSSAVLDLMEDDTVSRACSAECQVPAACITRRDACKHDSALELKLGPVCGQAGLAAQQRRFHWDKRKRRYVQLQPDEKVQAGKRKRTESGKMGRKRDQPSGLYKKWVRSSKLRVPATGELPDAGMKDAVNLSER